MTADLVQFLRARLDEDEQVARLIAPGGYEPDEWRTEPSKSDRWLQVFAYSRTLGEPPEAAVRESDQPVAIVQSGRNEALHIARHDPARVLAEVDAKRQILALHGTVYREIGWLSNGEEEQAEIPVCGLCAPKHSHYRHRNDVPEGACQTVRLLVLPYADHPDCWPEWAPDQA